MRTRRSSRTLRSAGARLLLAMAVVTGASQPLPASEMTRFAVEKASSITLDGSSNIARWQCKGTTINGLFEVRASLDDINTTMDRLEKSGARSFSPQGASGETQPAVDLRIPVSSLGCGNPKMNHDMYAALKSERYPIIQFRFREVRGAIARDAAHDQYRATIRGDISLAGTTRTLDLDVIAERIDRQHFRVRSSIPVRMTDFGITPPTGLFGMIKARNELVVGFNLLLKTGPHQVPTAVVMRVESMQ